MSVHIVEEANRCLGCRRAMCQERGCPVHTPIPQVISLFKERRLDEAGALLFDNNPLSAVCSLVCNHSGQCEGSCVRGRKGTPVHFSSIESFVSSAYLDRLELTRPEPCGRSVAVVGSGPAGITCAIKMALLGCSVTVFEQRAEVGGVLRYGIPEFRLPRELVEKYRAIMCSLGVRVRPSTTIGGAISIEDLLRDGYDAVFVGTGTWRARKLHVHGETRGNVFFGIDYLVDPDSVAIGHDVVVIGVGNVAMDVARTALRHGARKVTLYARADEISASSEEVEYAELEGAEIVRRMQIVSIDERGCVFRRSVLAEDGSIAGFEDGEVHVDCDTVIIAASQCPKDKLVLTTDGLSTTERGTLEVDERGMTTRAGVFAAGDVVDGPLTVVHAVAGAKRAVAGMVEYLGLSERAEALAHPGAAGVEPAAGREVGEA